jgi:Family of unknown function (DUF5764)
MIQVKQKSDAQALLQEYIIEPILGLFDDMFEDVRRRDNRLMTFQRKLKEIPHWRADVELATYVNILDGRCGFLNELITALYLYHIKNIASIQNAHASNVQISLPPKNTFIHNIMVAMAKAFYEDPMMFRRNARAEKEAVAHRAVESYIAKSLPVKDILDAYIAASINPGREGNVVVLHDSNPVLPLLEQVRSEVSNFSSNLAHQMTNLNHAAAPAKGGPNAAEPATPATPLTPHSFPSPGDEEDEGGSPEETPSATPLISGGSNVTAPSTLGFTPAPGKHNHNNTASVMPGAAAAPPAAADVKTIVESERGATAERTASDIFPDIKATSRTMTAALIPEASGAGSTAATLLQAEDAHAKPVAVRSIVSRNAGSATSASASSAAGADKKKAPRSGGAGKAPGVGGRGKKAAALVVVEKAAAAQRERGAGASGTADSVSTSTLSKKQQRELLDEILKYTRTRELVTPSFFSDAESKET